MNLSKTYLVVRLLIDLIKLGFYFLYFFLLGKTPQRGYLLMRSIYINSDGWITKFLTRVYRNYFSYFSKDKPLAKNTQNISIKFAKNKDELYQMGFSILEKNWIYLL